MTSNLIDEIAQYLATNGIGTLGTNIFEGNMPDDINPAVCVYDTAGLADDIDIPLFMPSFQIVIRATNLDEGETISQNIRNLLHDKYNIQFVTNGTYVYACNLTGHGGHIGQDTKGRDTFSLNFQCRVR